MSYYSNASQLYFDFVYDHYLNEHSKSKYLLDLINVIDWPVVPNFNLKCGYNHTLEKIKSVLFQKRWIEKNRPHPLLLENK